MRSDFAPELVKYPKSSPKLQNNAKWCVSLLYCSVKRCSFLIMISSMQFHGIYCMAAGLCPFALLLSECTVSQGLGLFSQFLHSKLCRVKLLTRFCKLLTTVAILSGRHVSQVPQWHDTSDVTTQ